MRIATQYQPFFNNWDRRAGRKPTSKHFSSAHQLARPGSKNALALAMALREKGATQPQITLVTGAPHRNVIKDVVVKHKAKVKVSHAPDGRKVYRLSLKNQ